MLLLRFLFLFFSAVKETSCSFSQPGIHNATGKTSGLISSSRAGRAVGRGQHWAKGTPGGATAGRGAHAAPMVGSGLKPPGMEAPRCRARCHRGLLTAPCLSHSTRDVSGLALGVTAPGVCGDWGLPASAGCPRG